MTEKYSGMYKAQIPFFFLNSEVVFFFSLLKYRQLRKKNPLWPRIQSEEALGTDEKWLENWCLKTVFLKSQHILKYVICNIWPIFTKTKSESNTWNSQWCSYTDASFTVMNKTSPQNYIVLSPSLSYWNKINSYGVGKAVSAPVMMVIYFSGFKTLHNYI